MMVKRVGGPGRIPRAAPPRHAHADTLHTIHTTTDLEALDRGRLAAVVEADDEHADLAAAEAEQAQQLAEKRAHLLLLGVLTRGAARRGAARGRRRLFFLPTEGLARRTRAISCYFKRRSKTRRVSESCA